MAATTSVPVAEQFLAALSERDYHGIASCFTRTAKLRVLVPSALREEDGPQAIADRFRFWYADLDDFELREAEVDVLADRVRLRYRLRGHDPEDGPVVSEQEGYATVEDGEISALNLVCSGWRPTA